MKKILFGLATAMLLFGCHFSDETTDDEFTETMDDPVPSEVEIGRAHV